MAGIPGLPQNFNLQTANGQNLVSWSLSTGATSYIVQRSLDDITYTTLVTLSGSPLATSYLDIAVVLGTTYYYKVASSNVSGTSSYTLSQSATPTPTGELTLAQIRLKAQQRADRVNSNFVTLTEWNSYINQSMFELYDLLVTVYEDYFIAPPILFISTGTSNYRLPNGSNTFLDINNAVVTPRPFYKMVGVDRTLNASNNAYVTVHKFNFIDRNKYSYAGGMSAFNGITEVMYRIMGNNLEFIPSPASGQLIKLWYIPRLIELLQETDTTDIGISGWIEYVIVRAAYFALTKEESDTTALVMQLGALQKRIEESAANRDAGMPDTVSNSRDAMGRGRGGYGYGDGY